MNGLFEDLRALVSVITLALVAGNIIGTVMVAYHVRQISKQVRGYADGYNAGMNDANVLTGNVPSGESK